MTKTDDAIDMEITKYKTYVSFSKIYNHIWYCLIEWEKLSSLYRVMC